MAGCLLPHDMIGFQFGLRRLRSTVAQVRDRSFPYVRRPPRRRNWHLYDLAQTHELEEILDLIGLVVDTDSVEQAGVPSPRRAGRPRVPLADRLKALLWQSYRGVANRPTEGELRVLELGLGRRF